MMFNLLIICAIILIIALAIAIITVWAIWLDHRHKKSLEELSKYQMHLGMPINDIPTILNMVIDECFTDYKIKFLSLNDKPINDAEEKLIRSNLTDMVVNRMSPAVLDKLSTYYNLKNIGDIIADKIYIIVLQYVSDHNAKILG